MTPDITPGTNVIVTRTGRQGTVAKVDPDCPDGLHYYVDDGSTLMWESDVRMAEKPEIALRFNEGKPELRYILCFAKGLEALARTCMIGAAKYALYNFMKPTPVSRSFDCLQRHMAALWNGELVDAEGNPHVGAIIFNALQIAENLETDMDDRPGKVIK